MAMRALVVGYGCHGRAIVEALVRRGHAVTIFDRVRPGPGCIEGCTRFVEGSTLSLYDLRNACAGVDTVFHTASVSPWCTRHSPAELHNLHVVGTQLVIEACLLTGVARLVYTSTSAVSTSDPLRPRGGVGEGLHPPAQGYDVNTRSRAAAEAAVLAANYATYRSPDARGRLRTVSLRPQLCFGPHGRLLPELIRLIRRRSLSAVVGDGSNVVDFLCIENSAHAHLLAAEALRRPSSPAPGKAYVIGNGEPVPAWAAIHTLLGMLGDEALQPSVGSHWGGLLRWVGARCRELMCEGVLGQLFGALGFGGPTKLPWAAEVPSWVLCMLAQDGWFAHNLASAELGYAPRVSLMEGLARTAQWISHHGLDDLERVAWD